MVNVEFTFDEVYQFVKLYDILRDMDFELTELQESVFDKFLVELMSDKLVHNTKTSLREESKLYLPTVKEFYPHLD